MVNHNVEHKEIIMEEFTFFCLGMGVALSMFLAMAGVVYGINKVMGEDYDL
jgi:Na+-transporting methylmalonyl-CoA/oxaloacetate decarboxylase gamma subunit